MNINEHINAFIDLLSHLFVYLSLTYLFIYIYLYTYVLVCIHILYTLHIKTSIDLTTRARTSSIRLSQL